jgi:hypothetical protein
MKTTILTAFFLMQWIGNCLGGLSIPNLPPHKLEVPEVLAIFYKLRHNDTNCSVIAIDWHKASDFQPQFGDATYSPANDHPDEYSWFVTYLYKDELLEKLLADRPVQSVVHRQFNSVGVMRIKDDGQMGVFIGYR